MMKRIALLILTLGSSLAVYAAAPPDTIKVSAPDSGLRRVYYDAALPITTSTDRRAGWSYFWMFDDGTFSRDTSFALRQDASPSSKKVKAAVRGRYHGDQEPPTANRTVNVGALPADKKMLRAAQNDSICLQWNAARQGDSLFMALIVKNPGQLSSSGYLKLRFPSYYLKYKEQVFSASNFSTMTTQYQPGIAAIADREIRIWRITDLPAGKEIAIFVRMEVKQQSGVAITSSLPNQLIEMEYTLNSNKTASASQTAGEDQGTGIVYNADVPKKVGTASDGSENATNAVSFSRTSQATLAINYARDPNYLEVDKTEIEPTDNSSALLFNYTMHVENLGNSFATHLRVRTAFDPLLNKATMNYNPGTTDNHFPFGLPEIAYCPFPAGKPDTVFWTFKYANLAGDPKLIDADRSMPNQNKADYDYKIQLLPGKKLVSGDVIRCRARVEMMTNNSVAERGSENALPPDCQMPFIKEDNVITEPCIIRVLAPPRVQFGSIIGVKLHRFHKLFETNPDSIGSSGISLTWRIPIFRPRFNNNGFNSMQRLPHWYWQVELGYVKNEFQSNQGRINTEGAQLTPIQIRYIQPFRTYGKRFCIGASVGYNLAYASKINSGGREITLPDDKLKRFEQEIFGSIDIQNKIDVPTLTFGLGYKIRENYALGSTIQSRYPFAYIQFEPLRIRRGFAKWMKKVCRW